MYNIYAIVILILFDIPRFSVNDLHQIQVAAPSPSCRKLTQMKGRVIGEYEEEEELHCTIHIAFMLDIFSYTAIYIYPVY